MRRNGRMIFKCLLPCLCFLLTWPDMFGEMQDNGFNDVYRIRGKVMNENRRQPPALGGRRPGVNDKVEFNGLLLWSDAWSSMSTYPFGLYGFSTSGMTPVKRFNIDANALTAVFIDGYYYVVTREVDYSGSITSISILKYDITTGSKVNTVNIDAPDYSRLPLMLTHDRSTGNTYALTYSADYKKNILATIDLATGAMTTVGTICDVRAETSILTFSCAENGFIYSIDSKGNLYTINTSGGAYALVGPTGVSPRYLQSTFYNPDTATLWWAASLADGSATLYTVDVATGTATEVSPFPNNEEYVGLYMDLENPDVNAPRSVSDLRLVTDGGSTYCTINFTLPSETNGGTPLDGNLTAEISVDGVVAETLEGRPGNTLSFPLTLDEGLRSIGVTVLTSTGSKSSMGSISRWIGLDAPAAVTSLTLADENGKACLEWNASSGGQHGGYCPVENIRYRIVRNDGVQVADGLSVTSFSEDFPEVIAEYSYIVIPCIGDKEGLPSTSNSVSGGDYYVTPFFYDFNNEVKFNRDLDIVDHNNDGYTWEQTMTWDANVAAASYSPNWNNAADDYLIFPRVRFRGGTVYKVSFETPGLYGTSVDKIRIFLGNGSDVSRYTTVIADFTISQAQAFYEANFTIEEDMICNPVLYVYSDAGANYLRIDNFRIEELGSCGAPAAPEITLTVIPGSINNQVKVTVGTPSLTIDGNPLTAIDAIDLYRGDVNSPVHTFANPAPGTDAEWIDTDPGDGPVEYRVAGRNADGRGLSASAEVFVGGMPLPYSYDFTDPDGFRYFTVDNVNGDESTWTLNDNCAKYSYNMFADADDWLFSPNLRLNSGRVYELVAELHTSAETSPENLAITCGRGATPEKQETIIDLKDYVSVAPAEHSSYIHIDESGLYNIGFHAYSPRNRLNIFIDRIEVKDIADVKAPSMPRELTVISDASGLDAAEIGFIVPSTDCEGNTLTSIASVEIYRGNEKAVAYVFTDIVPGQSVTWRDNEAIGGSTSYRVVAVNEYGAGLSAYGEAYIGFDAPAAVTSLKIKGDATNSNAMLSWDASVGGIHGGVLDPSSVTYTVTRIDNWNPTIIASGLTETGYTDNCNITGAQHAVEYRVTAENSFSSSDVPAVASGTVVLGELSAYPLNQPFTNYLSEEWTTTILTNYNCSWYVVTDEPQEIPTIDGCGGVLVFNKYTEDEQQALGIIRSPKVSLDGAVNPGIGLAVYHDPSEDSRKHIVVGYNHDDEGFVELQDIVINSEVKGWREYAWIIPESDRGGFISVEIRGECYDAGNYEVIKRVYVDNLSVDDVLQHNLSIASFEGDDELGSEGASLRVGVVNKGQLPATDYSVVLTCNGEDVDSRTAGTLDVRHTADIIFDIPAPAAVEAGNTRVYQARIDYSADMNNADNFSETHNMKVLGSLYPGVDEISGELNGNNVVLSWGEPDRHYSPSVLESFENLTPFAISDFDNWVLYDGDGQRTYGIRYGLTFTDWYTPKAWQVWDPVRVALEGKDVQPHSGYLCLIGMSSDGTIPGDDEAHTPFNDDWLISEEIVPGSQVVFWIMQPVNTYGGNEAVEVLYSTGSQTVSDFAFLERFELSSTVDYMRCSVTMPADARYFAIRHNQSYFGIWLDDITYTPVRNKIDLALERYNVYRDNELIGSTVSTGYTDVSPAEGYHIYAVAPVFDCGEGRLSKTVGIDVDYVGLVNDLCSDGSPVVTGNRGCIRIKAKGRYDVDVVVPDGRRIISKTVEGDISLPVAPGIYIVKAGSTVAKVKVY